MKKSQCSVDVKMETSTEIASPPLFKFAANALSSRNISERIEEKCCQLFDTWAEEVHADYVRFRDKEEDELEVKINERSDADEANSSSRQVDIADDHTEIYSSSRQVDNADDHVLVGSWIRVQRLGMGKVIKICRDNPYPEWVRRQLYRRTYLIDFSHQDKRDPPTTDIRKVLLRRGGNREGLTYKICSQKQITKAEEEALSFKTRRTRFMERRLRSNGQQ
jgi:hypothetical protein